MVEIVRHPNHLAECADQGTKRARRFYVNETLTSLKWAGRLFHVDETLSGALSRWRNFERGSVALSKLWREHPTMKGGTFLRSPNFEGRTVNMFLGKALRSLMKKGGWKFDVCFSRSGSCFRSFGWESLMCNMFRTWEFILSGRGRYDTPVG